MSSAQWIAVVMLAFAAFFGAGTFSMWRAEHRGAAIVLAVIAAAFLAVAIVAMIPGPDSA